MASDKKTNAQIRAKQLEDNRLDWEADWKNITDYLLPERGRYSGDLHNKRKKSGTKVANSLPKEALYDLSAGMQSGLTSPAMPWFHIALEDDRYVRNTAIMAWLDYVEKLMYRAFKNSNFYGNAKALFTELGAFGTGAMYVEDRGMGRFMFKVLTTGTYAIGVGADGRADSLYRTFWMSAREIKRIWPDTISQTIRSAIDAKMYDKFFEVCHLVHPRESYDPDKIDNLNMPFESLFWEKGAGDTDFLEESGYQEFPFVVPRWDVTAEDVYGQGPGHMALPEIKLLQQYEKGGIVAVQKILDSPVIKNPAMKSRLDRSPGAENVGPLGGERAIEKIDDVNGAGIQILEQYFIEWITNRIRGAFFADIFSKISDRDELMKATVANLLDRERTQKIGAVINNLEYEFLTPLFIRVFNCLLRAGLIPDPPPELAGQELKMDFVGRLAQAQKQNNLIDIETATRYVLELAQAVPSVLDKLDADAAVDEYAEKLALPFGILRAADQVKQLREFKAQQAAEQAEIQKATMAAQGMKNEALANKVAGEAGAQQ